MGISLNARVSILKGVGPNLEEKLKNLNVARVGDLLLHLPMRYQNRSHVVPLRTVNFEQECLVEGQITASEITFGKRRSLLVSIDDGTGVLTLRYFYFSKQQRDGFTTGRYVRAYGVARFGPKRLEMVHPEYKTSDSPLPPPEAALTPVYSTTDGLGQARLRKLTQQALQLDFADETNPDLQSSWPLEQLAYLHQPPADASAADIQQVQQAIAFEELTAYYLVMQHRQSQRQQQQTLPLPPAQQLGRALLSQLGFKLTEAQRRATTEVLNDLARSQPMLRLIQGDVGSGKTVVAAFAAIRAAEHGAQTAIMAPTEILAEQHYLNLSAWLSPLGIDLVLLTGSQKTKERRAGEAALADGTALVAVGTHALFQRTVEFHNLALTIVDEQHRFGVHQRMALRNKGRVPHQLVLTATPIPRTLTMALYADMDVSLIDELPAGRQPITTILVNNNRRHEILERAQAIMDTGQQVYWVCTLIEPADELPASAAEPTLEELQQALRGYRIGLIHGRMSGSDKASTMQAFKAGEIQLLVATTVIEVGVDAPNATLIVIEDPNRLGLAQLHQLRGRVGRGDKASHCVLLYKTPLGKLGQTRLQVIRDSQDGFYIAEQDLLLRGPGEILGTRQTGEQQFRIADLARDAVLIPKVIEHGKTLLANDPAQAQRLLATWAPADTGTVGV